MTIVSFFSSRRLVRVAIVSGTAFVLCVLVVASVYMMVMRSSRAFIRDKSGDLPKAQAALVLGAKVYADGRLSDMLQDRADAAIDLYKNQQVKKILVSGDHGTKSYDEVNAVKTYLLKQGVNGNDIFLDHAGFSTYDSFYRARDVFRVSSLTVVTQDFHLPRAVYLGRSLGLETFGLKADKRYYGNTTLNYLREVPADVKAFFQVLTRAEPKFLGEPIPIEGDGHASWD